MTFTWWQIYCALLVLPLNVVETRPRRKPIGKPNVIVIVVDDLGWDDVSFHGNPQIATPNIDVLAFDGVILNNFYVQPTSTATRAALLTGLYPVRLGLQHGDIEGSEPYGLPLHVKTLPQYLRSMGYATHLVGKWHLGFAYKEYLPTSRGFDTHYGSYQAWLDPWDHTYQADPKDDRTLGKDIHYNGRPLTGTEGTHILQLLTQRTEAVIQRHDESKPLFLYLGLSLPKNLENTTFVPPAYKDKFNEVKKPELLEFVGLMSMLDEAVANITSSLHQKGLLNNSLLVFTTDSGAPPNGGHSNWPLRGVQGDLWEGAIRGTAFVWSPLLKKGGVISRELMHVTDLFPTILRASGYNINDLSEEIDGINMWEVLNFDIPSQRAELLHNIDPVTHTAAIRSHYMKMVAGNFRVNATQWKRRFAPPIEPTTVAAMLEQFNDSNMAPTIKVIVEGLHGRFDLNKTGALYKTGSKCEVLNKILKRLQERAISRAKLMQNNMTHILKELKRHPAGSPPLTLACDDRRQPARPCQPGVAPCLFDIQKDPCEKYNEAKLEPRLLEHLINRLHFHNKTAVPLIKKAPDPKGFPAFHRGYWKPWLHKATKVRPVYVQAPVMSQTESNGSPGLSLRLACICLVMTCMFHLSMS